MRARLAIAKLTVNKGEMYTIASGPQLWCNMDDRHVDVFSRFFC